MYRPSSAKVGAFSDNNQPSYTSAQTNVVQPSKPAKDSKDKVIANDYVPKRFGLKYDPPTIILEYLIPSSGKLYHHKLKMPQLKWDSDTMETLEYLQKKHSQYFLGNKVSEPQIKNLIEKLKKKLQGTAGAGSYGGSTFLTAGDSGYGASSGLKAGKLAPISSGLAGKTTNNVNNAQSSQSSAKKDDKKKDGNNFWEFDDIEDDDDEEKIDYNQANLNKLNKEELQKHKDKMDVLFNKNQKKPGDAGFVYDKQEEFVPQEENEWDEDEDF